jgi:hypothetical protein
VPHTDRHEPLTGVRARADPHAQPIVCILMYESKIGADEFAPLGFTERQHINHPPRPMAQMHGA